MALIAPVKPTFCPPKIISTEIESFYSEMSAAAFNKKANYSSKISSAPAIRFAF